jgi:hypothetical protein
LRRSPDIAQIAPDVSRGFVDAIVNAYDGLPAPIRAGLQTYNYRIDVVRSLPESLPEVAPYALLGVAGLHRPRHIVLSEFVLHPANRLKRSDLSGAIVLRHEVGHAADWIHNGPRQSMLSSSPGFIRALRIDLARLRTASQRAKAKTSAQQLGFPWYDDFAVHTARGRGELFAITFAAMLNGQIGPNQREILTSFSRTRTFIDRTVMWV